jgi:hypothetical protein
MRKLRKHAHAIAKSASGAPATRPAAADQKLLDQARASRHRSTTPISVKIVSHFWKMACRRELRWIRSMVSRSGTDPPRVSAQRVMGRRSASARAAASWSRSRSRRGVVLYWSRKASAQASGSRRSSTGQVSEHCSPRLRSRLLDLAYRADAAFDAAAAASREKQKCAIGVRSCNSAIYRDGRIFGSASGCIPDMPLPGRRTVRSRNPRKAAASASLKRRGEIRTLGRPCGRQRFSRSSRWSPETVTRTSCPGILVYCFHAKAALKVPVAPLALFVPSSGASAADVSIDQSRGLRPARRLRGGEDRRREAPSHPVRPRTPVPSRALRVSSPADQRRRARRRA